MLPSCSPLITKVFEVRAQFAQVISNKTGDERSGDEDVSNIDR